MATLLEEYIAVRPQIIAVYVATRPILTECRQGKRKRGQYRTTGGGSNGWTWTSTMHLDQTSASPAYVPVGDVGAGHGRTIGLPARGRLCRPPCVLSFLFCVESTFVGYQQ